MQRNFPTNRKCAPKDPDLDRGQAYFAAMLASCPSDGLADESGSQETTRLGQRSQGAAERVRRTTAGNPVRPDSSQGLATYFLDKCPPISWSGGLERGNFWQIVGIFSGLKKDGVTPDLCRSLIDAYFNQLGTRVPNHTYAVDFRFRCQRLLLSVQGTGATNTAEDYARPWAPAPTEAQAQAYSDSWKGL